MKDIKKTYIKEAMTIKWQSEKCIHAGQCVKMLPNVYKPSEKPWIKPENASINELIKQIEACPSGALSYEISNIKTK